MVTPSFNSTRSLRNLYFVRTAFQVVWAASVIITAIKLPLVAAVLFFLYPLWDVACTMYDLSTFSKSGSSRNSQIVNALLGVAAAIGIGLTVFQRPMYAVAIFGVWAFGAGVLQLVAGLIRRKQLGGGQWSMILSGAQSALAGVAFLVFGLQDKRHIKDVGGYAIFGALYFLIGGILLTRKLPRSSALEANTLGLRRRCSDVLARVIVEGGPLTICQNREMNMVASRKDKHSPPLRPPCSSLARRAPFPGPPQRSEQIAHGPVLATQPDPFSLMR